MHPESELIKLCYGKWKNGYYEGNPLDPYATSSYGKLGFISVLYVIYQICIKPYIKSDSRVLEIGPGRGAWTKVMLPAKEVWCLDVNSAEHNKFWEYVGLENKAKVKYIKVEDFSCSELPNSYFDFLFSYGTFCHIPWEGQCKYYRALYPKMKKGATAMVMFSDFKKFDAALKKYGRWNSSLRLHLANIIRSLRNMFLERKDYSKYHRDNFIVKNKNHLWFHAEIKETCQFLSSIGWEVINPDMDLCPRDPIAHFRKPL